MNVRLVGYLASAVLTLTLGSCLASFLSEGDRPSYEAVSAMWDDMAPGCGRIVLYRPETIVVAEMVTGLPSTWPVRLDGDASADLPRHSFVFADVAAGSHSVSSAGRTIKFEVRQAETVYIELESGIPRLIATTDALERLQGLEHRFRDDLPFNL